MNDTQWQTLLKLVQGEIIHPQPLGFIIDSPWLPGWHGTKTLDYFTSDRVWFEANKRAIETFPDIIFLPGFWSEYGMCTEPSAFGAKCVWEDKNLPHAETLIEDEEELSDLLKHLKKPNPQKDGLLPFMLNRMIQSESDIQAMGHCHRFAVSRGPLNIASFLMGTTAFLTAVAIYPEEVLALLDLITEFICDWIELQAKTFDTIGGVLILDDLVGFIGDKDTDTFAMPFLNKIFNHLNLPIRFFHNDAHGLVCAPKLAAAGINFFNFSHRHSLAEMRKLVGPQMVLVGNIPPLDIMAKGTPATVTAHIQSMAAECAEAGPVLLSAGGGMPQGVPTDNLRALSDFISKS